MARKLFIFFGIIVFALYCWASVVYQNVVTVPGYTLAEVDLLHGMTREKWDAIKQEQFQYLMALETKKYQLPEDTDLGISPDKALTSADFTRFIADAPPGKPVKILLRDSSEITSLISKKYLLRDSVHDPADSELENSPIYAGGHPIDKTLLDTLRQHGVKKITVTGHAAPVNFQVGTALMIALIFFVLVAALKPILWDPFRVMLEKRKWELDMGAEAERQAQTEKSRFEEEKRRRTGDFDRDIQTLRMQEQRETAKQVGAIVNEARDKGKEQKLAGLRDIGREAHDARQRMDGEIPALAQAIADAVAPEKNDRAMEVE